MKKVTIEIKIESTAHRIDYLLLENKNLNPQTHFRFINGDWVAKLSDFPIDNDYDLDVLIIAIGNPMTTSVMSVTIDGISKGTFKLYKPFNKNGYGQFNQAIPV
ncbi:hypothetical protein [Chryseobacterium luquanense]|uniref:Uncharacterized protein n=1 Tax=Chryseobacterium luquanense TaxID=2983766 RepID=A0ABT3XYA1_9FLAO|nr:hypothetical protein [Chryseobacterium luquanense]MCX8530865.1 hypothetical protein [Chryseobacterium luquanense]